MVGIIGVPYTLNMGEPNGDNPRIKRIEEHIEVIFRIQRDMQQEHQSLLRAQVLQGEEMREMRKRSEEASKRTDERFQTLAEAQERMDVALTAVMGTLDGFGKRTDELIQRLDATLQGLAESQQRTDTILRDLLNRTS